MIELRRVYDPPTPKDAYAVFVDRLWPRGFKKEAAWWDEWLREVAPSPELRRWFCHDPAKFEEFSRHYRAELLDSDDQRHLRRLAGYPRLILAYAAKDPLVNHARVLRDVLETLQTAP